MRQLITITPSPTLPVPATIDLSEAERYAAQAAAPNSVTGYTSDWNHFAAWCAHPDRAGAVPLPAAPELVAAYFASMAQTHTRATMLRRLASISRQHAQAGLIFWRSHPAIRDTMRGIARDHGRPQVKAAALMTREVRAMVETCTDSLAGVRDAALILVGMAGALRRSELGAMRRENLQFQDKGLRILLTEATKGDQQRAGALIVIPYGRHELTCPVIALRRWLDAAAITAGPVFRRLDRGRVGDKALSGEGIRLIVRGRALMAGIEAPPGERISPHGLRSGCITQMDVAGVPVAEGMIHARQRSHVTYQGYIRTRLTDDSPAGLLGL